MLLDSKVGVLLGAEVLKVEEGCVLLAVGLLFGEVDVVSENQWCCTTLFVETLGVEVLFKLSLLNHRIASFDFVTLLWVSAVGSII